MSRRRKLQDVKAPLGHVAIVFTDVQDSTKLWEADQESMSSAVKVHHAAMRQEMRKFHGYEVKTEGDAFMVAFPATRDAAKWCLHMQEVLLTLDYPPSLLTQPSCKVQRDAFGAIIWRGLRVRMGIHSGVPESSLDPVTARMDYYGPMVNLAARVSSLAKGGQIVLSKDAFDEVRGDLRALGLPCIEDTGLQELKGISRSIRAYTAVPDKLSQRDFTSPTDHAAEVGRLQRMTAELYADLDNLDPHARAQAGKGPGVAKDLHPQPVVVDMSWVGPELPSPESGVERVRALQGALSSIAAAKYSSAQQRIDRVAFTEAPEEVIDTACDTIEAVAANIYSLARSMVDSLPSDHGATLQSPYSSLLAELRTLIQSSSLVRERVELLRDVKEDQEEQLAQLDAQLAECEQQLSQKQSRHKEPSEEDEEEDQEEREIENVVCMIQVEDALLLHRKVPEAFREGVRMLKEVVDELMLKSGGERTNYGVDYVAPLGLNQASFRGKEELLLKAEREKPKVALHDVDAAEWSRPEWCCDTEYTLLFTHVEDTLWFAVELQSRLASLDWPKGLLKHPSCRVIDLDKTRVWAGLRVRVALHKGVLPPPALSPPGIRWYSGPVLQRCSRVLAGAAGGEILASPRVIASYTEAKETQSPRLRRTMERVTLMNVDRGLGEPVWLAVPASLVGRLERRPNPPVGRFLDVRFWITGAPDLPPGADQIGFLEHQLKMKEVREEEVMRTVQALLEEHEVLALGIAESSLESHERQAMERHDEMIKSLPPQKGRRRSSAGRSRTVSRPHRQLLEMVKEFKCAEPSPRPPQRSAPKDLLWVYGTVRLFATLMRGFLATGPGTVTSEHFKKVYARRVLSEAARQDQSYREQFSAVLELALDVDDESLVDASRVAEAIGGILAKLFVDIKGWKRRSTVEANKAANEATKVLSLSQGRVRPLSRLGSTTSSPSLARQASFSSLPSPGAKARHRGSPSSPHPVKGSLMRPRPGDLSPSSRSSPSASTPSPRQKSKVPLLALLPQSTKDNNRATSEGDDLGSEADDLSESRITFGSTSSHPHLSHTEQSDACTEEFAHMAGTGAAVLSFRTPHRKL